MSEDKMVVDPASPDRKSSARNRSTDTKRSSHRSRSRDRRDRHKDDRRSRDRGSDRGHRDRDRSRERSRRDRGDRDRDRDRDRHRDHDRERERERRDRDRDRDREYRDRRRKRDEDSDMPDEDRTKRKRGDTETPTTEDRAPDAISASRSPSRPTSDRRDRSHERNGRFDDRERRRPRDARDELEDMPPRRRRSPPPRRRTPPPIKRPSPTYEAPPEDYNPEEPKEDDSEARSVFVQQLAARLTARDLGYFFEDKLGEGAVMDARIVTDRLSRRSKGIGYVELKSVELVDKAINLSGTVVMGLPIKVQHTEAERNRTHAGDGNLNLPPGVSAPHGPMQLYVGSLHFNLSESDIKQVFEPFGELEFVDLHKDPVTGRSKGYCFIQYKRAEDARMALEQMEGFELAGRTLRVNTVHEKGTVKYTQQDSLEDSGGGNLNAASRQALMQKLARIEPARAPVETSSKPVIAQTLQSKSVLLTNMFDPAEETEKDWDKDLAEDVKGECEGKYGQVNFIKVEKESQGEIYVKFETIDMAKQAIEGLNGRWFGGKQVTATFIPDALMQAMQ